MPREIKDWRKPRDEQETLPLEKLMFILRRIYANEQAEHLYEKLTKEDTETE